MRYITTIFIFIILAVLSLAPPIVVYDMQQQYQRDRQATEMQIESLQQENATLRQELERMQQESSRGGNRRWMEISYYTTAADECGKDDGITASGTQATVGRTIAAGPGIPFGTRVWIDGHMYIVEDRGGAISNDRLDVLVGSKSEAFALGRQHRQVVIER